MNTGMKIGQGLDPTHSNFGVNTVTNVNNLDGLQLLEQPNLIGNNGIQFNYTAMNDDSNYVQNMPIDPSAISNQLEAPKNQRRKARRFWTGKEEALLFEIWGRENWRLQKHGKNTHYFAEWALELKEKYNINIRLEEIQCKVNQTRAKYRSVQRLMESNSGQPNWKKYYVVSKILNNEYQPKCAEQIRTPDTQLTTEFNSTNASQKYQSSQKPSSDTSTITDPFHKMMNSGNWGRFQCAILPEYNTSYNVLNEPPKQADSIESNRNLDDKDISSSESEDDEWSTEDLNGHESIDKVKVKSNVVENFTQQSPNPSTKYSPKYLSDLLQNKDQLLKVEEDPKNHLKRPFQDKDFYSNDVNCNANKRYDFENQDGIDTLDKDISINCQPINKDIQKNNETTPSNASSATKPIKQTLEKNKSIEYNCYNPYQIEELYLKEVREKNSILSDQRRIAKERLQLEKRKMSLLENFLPKYLNLQQQILQNLEKLETDTNPNSNSTCQKKDASGSQ